MVKIAVLGAGVNGLSCAVRIKEQYNNFQVKIISSDFSPNTTGDGSGGLWYPYECGNTPLKRIDGDWDSAEYMHKRWKTMGFSWVVLPQAYYLRKWGGETFEYLRDLWYKGDVNVCLMPIYELCIRKENFSKPDWLNIVYGYQELDRRQLEIFSQRYSTKYVAGQTFITFVVSPPSLLAYLQKRFVQANGELLRAKIESFEDPILKEFDIVINCTGLGARFLVPDKKVAPVRGQIIKVKAPWINETVIDDSGHYVIPNVDTCVLGGTHQHSYDTKVDPKDIDFILKGCKKMMPGLEYAKVVSHWTGLRPGREEIRLEPEEINGKLYIHNYGHGGSGFTLFWGCSSEVLKILKTFLSKTNTSHRTSKL